MLLLDTTVLTYAIGGEHPLQHPCQRVVAAIGSGVLATTTPEAIQEFAHIRSRRHGRENASAFSAEFLRLLAPLTLVEAADIENALQLWRQHPRLGAFDCVLAAVALNRQHISALISADKAFASVPGLKHIDPADPQALASVGIR